MKEPEIVNPGYLCATHVDANPGNGTFRLSPDFPAIGAGTNSRVRALSNSGESHSQKDLPPDRVADPRALPGAPSRRREPAAASGRCGTCDDQLIDSKRRLSEDLLEGGAEVLLTEMQDDDLLKLVALDRQTASEE